MGVELAMAEERVDGLKLLSEISGVPTTEIREMWEQTKEQSKRTAACSLHELELQSAKPFPKYRCKNCSWIPQPAELVRYEQGLAHGRAHATGGGK
jgi:hypothetical protein